MSGSQLAIKNRIRSIESTMKITKAMQLVAASKYQRQKERMSKNKEYAIELKELLDSILANIDNSDHPYLKKREDDHPCTIIYTSDMGLCGSFNANIFKLIAGASTLPPPSLPIPRSLMPLKTLIAVPEDDPDIIRPLIGLISSVSTALPANWDFLSIVCRLKPSFSSLCIKVLGILLTFLMPTRYSSSLASKTLTTER